MTTTQKWLFWIVTMPIMLSWMTLFALNMGLCWCLFHVVDVEARDRLLDWLNYLNKKSEKIRGWYSPRVP